MTPERRIGGRAAGRMGLGVQLLGASTSLSIDEGVRVIHAALDGGTRLLDTSDVYAPNGLWTGQGERLVGEALRRWSGDRDRLIVATKGGHLLGDNPLDITRDGRPEHLRSACEASLRALGVEAIGLYQLHSVDPATPLERSLEALAQLRAEGKIREIGLSNVGRGQLAQACAIAPIVSVQNRYSLLARQARGILDWCGEHGLSFLCYGPLGREAAASLGDKVAALARIAARHEVSPQRVALAWLLAQGDHVLPIPGATLADQARDNIAAGDLQLTAADLEDLEAASASAP